jgi:hypothetical protein
MTGSNFSSWFRNEQGTFYTEAYDKNKDASSATMLSVVDVINYNEWGIRYEGVNGYSNYYAYTNGGYTINLTGTSAKNKMSVSYNTSGISFYGDGTSIATSSINPVVRMDYMVIGKDWPGTGYNLNGHIKKIAYYPVRLSNAELTGLTTA